MSTMVIIAVSAVLMILLAIPLLIFPLLAFIHSIRNPNLTTATKIAWGCLIFFTWTLGATIYGIVASGRPFYRNMGIATACLMLMAVLSKEPLRHYQAKLENQLAARKVGMPPNVSSASSAHPTLSNRDINGLGQEFNARIKASSVIGLDVGTPVKVFAIPHAPLVHTEHGSVIEYTVVGPRGKGHAKAMYIPGPSSVDKKEHFVLMWMFKGSQKNFSLD